MSTNSQQTEPGSQAFYHYTTVQVRFNDIDLMGHVNNAVYQDYFDFGKVSYFNTILGMDVNWDKTGLVLAKITIEYFSAIGLNDEIEIRSKIIRLGNKSLDMYQEIILKETSEIMASALSIMVGYSNSENETIAIPSDWRKKIINYEKM